ncbi:MAG: 23S rRNA (uracil(1939)-C(5))-methyltransferase RlmD [Solirubrobacteraceae bacterium]|nr:23S rRNA (uracil(1939)-C(5))-methyltransferase RlmD [Solirubrobacteraceae bacterium]
MAEDATPEPQKTPAASAEDRVTRDAPPARVTDDAASDVPTDPTAAAGGAATTGAGDPADAASSDAAPARRQRPPRPQRGEVVELRVDDFAHGGNGVARTPEGWVVFVRGGIPGDRVRARITKRKRDYGEALVVELLDASPDRIDPVADHPGAPWQVITYEHQLRIKQAQVEDAMRRLGGHADVEIEEIVPAEERWRYRNKLEYSFGAGPDGTLLCGFHAAGSWETIVHVEDCLLATERGNAIRRAVHAWCAQEGLSAYDRRTNEGFLRNLVVREGIRTGEAQVRLVTSPGEFDVDRLASHLHEALDQPLTGVLWTRIDSVGETTYGGDTEVVAGDPYLHEEMSDLRLRISPEGFFQTNTVMAERLYALAQEYAGLEGWERLFDLYCGSGSVGLSMASRVGELVGVEIVEDSIQDALHNAAINDVRNARFMAADARIGLPDAVERAGRPDVLVVDPPRAGLGPRVCRRIAEAAPRRIVYVSCNPTTLAPDAARLVEAGYVLRRVRPVDLFPQTPHVECVSVLDRVG